MRRRQFPAPDERRCSHINEAGERCAQYKMKVYGTCGAHTPEVRAKLAGATKGMQTGNQNGYKSGWYQKPLKPLATQTDLLDDLLIHHTQLSLAIADKGEALPVEAFAKVVSIQISNALRITRLMKEQSAVPFIESDVFNRVLDELSVELGVPL